MIKELKNYIHSLYNYDCCGIFESYKDAINDKKIIGYEDTSIVDVVCEKTRNYLKINTNKKEMQLDESLSRLLIILNLFKNNKEITVIDLGGALGLHYFSIKKLFNLYKCNIKINWIVIETEQMVLKSQEFENDELKFYPFSELDNIVNINHVDLVFASGSLQYTPEPEKVLDKLININSDYIFITRTPFIEEDNAFTSIQASLLCNNGVGNMPKEFENKKVYYPITFLPKKHVEETLSISYKTLLQLQEDDGYRVKKYKSPIKMYGYLLEKN